MGFITCDCWLKGSTSNEGFLVFVPWYIRHTQLWNLLSGLKACEVKGKISPFKWCEAITCCNGFHPGRGSVFVCVSRSLSSGLELCCGFSPSWLRVRICFWFFCSNFQNRTEIGVFPVSREYWTLEPFKDSYILLFASRIISKLCVTTEIPRHSTGRETHNSKLFCLESQVNQH